MQLSGSALARKHSKILLAALACSLLKENCTTPAQKIAASSVTGAKILPGKCTYLCKNSLAIHELSLLRGSLKLALARRFSDFFPGCTEWEISFR